jgi:endogenous inhibitor of DNA gyrase (YacG/DUF329 family)
MTRHRCPPDRSGGRLLLHPNPLFQKATNMLYVTCPNCQTRVEISETAYGPNRTDPFNIAHCDECDCGFDYDDEDVEA